MDRGAATQYLYPQAEPQEDYYFVDDEAGGQRLEHWDEAKLGPRPTDQQLQAAWLPALKAQKRLQIRRAAFAEQDTHLAPGYEDRDYIHIILAAVQRTTDPRQAALLAIKTKLDGKIADIEKAGAEVDLEVISW